MAKDSGSRQGPTNTTVQTNSLPGFMEGPLKTAANAAQNTFQSGVGSTPYPGATYVPPTQNEMRGMNRLGDVANNMVIKGQLYDPAAAQWQGLLARQGMTSDHRGALNPAFDIATGRNRITTGGAFGRTADDLRGNLNASERHLGDAASGAFLGADGNPHFNEALGNASRDTMHGVNAQMASMGRLGSDAHSGVAGREVGELQTRARADQHNLERQMQMQAAGQMDQSRMSRLQGLLGALQGQTQVQGANIANQGQTSLALGDQFGSSRDAMLRSMALAPMLQDLRTADHRTLTDVGAAQRGELQDELQSNIDRFQGEQMQPWGQIGLLTSALQGFPNMGSVRSESTGTVPQGSRISGLLGGAATGAGVGSSFGPWGAGIGGLLGGLGGAFM